MLIILLNWFFAFLLIRVVSLFTGLQTQGRTFGNFVVGLAVLALLTQVWAFFFPAKYFLLVFLPGLVGLLIFKRRWNQLSGMVFPVFKKDNLVLLPVLLALAYLASLPFHIIDDISYYRPTIQWVGEYGFVKGLANLNIRLGLASSWHVILASLGGFLQVGRADNLNGLLLFLLCLELWQSGRNGKIATLPVLLVGSLFVNGPSPDLLIIYCTFWIIWNYGEIPLVTLALLTGFLVTVKVSAGVLLLLLVPRIWQRNRKELLASFFILSGFGILLLLRNFILTGNPLFPMNGVSDVAWAIDPKAQEFFKLEVLNEIFDSHVTGRFYDKIGLREKAVLFFETRPYKMVFNLLSLLSFLFLPAYIWFKTSWPNKKMLASVVFLIGILWIVGAPNYRFVLGFVLLSAAFVLLSAGISKLRPIVLNLLLLGCCLLAIFINQKGTMLLSAISCEEQQSKEQSSLLLEPVPYPKPVIQTVLNDSVTFFVAQCTHCFDTPLPCLPALSKNQKHPVPLPEDIILLKPGDISGGFGLRGR